MRRHYKVEEEKIHNIRKQKAKDKHTDKGNKVIKNERVVANNPK